MSLAIPCDVLGVHLTLRVGLSVLLVVDQNQQAEVVEASLTLEEGC